jgi:hypothetical protein
VGFEESFFLGQKKYFFWRDVVWGKNNQLLDFIEFYSRAYFGAKELNSGIRLSSRCLTRKKAVFFAWSGGHALQIAPHLAGLRGPRWENFIKTI